MHGELIGHCVKIDIILTTLSRLALALTGTLGKAKFWGTHALYVTRACPFQKAYDLTRARLCTTAIFCKLLFYIYM